MEQKKNFFAEIEACVAVVMVGIYFDVKMYRVSQGQRTEGPTRDIKIWKAREKEKRKSRKKRKGNVHREKITEKRYIVFPKKTD